MNTVGWLGGSGSAPLVIGWISQSQCLGPAIAMASLVYVLTGVLLFAAKTAAPLHLVVLQ
jgi:hypothetical protein